MTDEKKNERDNREYKEGYEDGRTNNWSQSSGSMLFTRHGDPYRKGLQAGREDRWKYGNPEKQKSASVTPPPKARVNSSSSYRSESHGRYRSSISRASSPSFGPSSLFRSALFFVGFTAILFVDLLIFAKGVLMLEAENLFGIVLVIIGLPGGVLGYFLIGVAESETLVGILDAILLSQ